MNLKWRYNNVRIKKEDEQKSLFSMPESIFELTVMFFRLTNLLATFQAIINNLLRDIIKTGNITVFIDDLIIRTETEERHNDIVEEVLKRMEKNDLFVKLEKCIEKVKKIGFLGVIIGPDGIKIKKEKIQGVVDWLVLRSVKNVQKFLRLENYYK